MILFEKKIATSLKCICDTYLNSKYQGSTLKCWSFDSLENRKSAQQRFASQGIEATFYSSYKSLVFAFLEHISLDNIKNITVEYPVIADTIANRFLLECYPLCEMLEKYNIAFIPKMQDDYSKLYYKVILEDKHSIVHTQDVFVPVIHANDIEGKDIFINSGFLEIQHKENSAFNEYYFFETEQYKAYAATLDFLTHYHWDDDGFDILKIQVQAPFYDFDLALGEEVISTSEAMHEDLYFSVSEIFHTLQNASLSDRTVRFGQIIPDIVISDECSVAISMVAKNNVNVDTNIKATNIMKLKEAHKSLSPFEIDYYLKGLAGERYVSYSVRGREVWGVYLKQGDVSVAISAAQHANEATGVVGALRGAYYLKESTAISFAISPLENPDGYHLYQELCKKYKRHMHHAARYTALGCDLEYMDMQYEKKIRHISQEKTQALLHINLHGYPSHEWVRPFSGYVPKNFDMWSIPKGFFLILRYHKMYKKLAFNILNAVVQHLCKCRELVDFNNMQLKQYARYVNDIPFCIENSIPLFVSEVEDGLYPITLITEAPDESVYDDRFLFLQNMQTQVVISASEALSEYIDKN